MAKKIERLTAVQEARFPEFVDRWVGYGLSTEPANRAAAEEAMRQTYIRGGLKPPARMVWCTSPLALVLTDAIAHQGASVGASVRASVWDSVWASVGDSVGASVGDSVGDSVGASVDCTGFYNHYFGGQFWVGWGYGWMWGGPSSISFALDVLGLDIGKIQELKARAYAAMCSSACWSYWTTDFVIVSERPSLIRKKSDGSLEIAEWTWTDKLGKACRWSVTP